MNQSETRPRPAFSSQCPNDADYVFRDGLQGYGFYLDHLKEQSTEDLDWTGGFLPIYTVINELVSTSKRGEMKLKSSNNLVELDEVHIKSNLEEDVEKKLTQDDLTQLQNYSQLDQADECAKNFQSELEYGTAELFIPCKRQISNQLKDVEDHQKELNEIFKFFVSAPTKDIECTLNEHGMHIFQSLHNYRQCLQKRLNVLQDDASGEELKVNQAIISRVTAAEELFEEKMQRLVQQASEQNERLIQQIKSYAELEEKKLKSYEEFRKRKDEDDKKSADKKKKISDEMKNLLQQYAEETKEMVKRISEEANMKRECEIVKNLHEEHRVKYEKSIETNKTIVEYTTNTHILTTVKEQFERNAEEHKRAWCDAAKDARYLNKELKETDEVTLMLYKYLNADISRMIVDANMMRQKKKDELKICEASHMDTKDLNKIYQDIDKAIKASETQINNLNEYSQVSAGNNAIQFYNTYGKESTNSISQEEERQFAITPSHSPVDEHLTNFQDITPLRKHMLKILQLLNPESDSQTQGVESVLGDWVCVD